MDHEAKHYEVIDSGLVRCLICPVRCKLKEGQEGICMGRKNRGGKMIATNYGEVVSMSIDPIEKKPLYHFHPGDPIISIGPNGCNLSCKNCQNWSISQERQPTTYLSPERLVEIASDKLSAGIAYTYTEPFIWFEYLLDTAEFAHKKGLYNVCVTNGYINKEPLEELLPFIDAVNIDVKSMRPEFYRRICKGNLETVIQTVETCAAAGVHVEVTNLVIPGMNDSDEDIDKLVNWLAGISRDLPLHISRYFPQHEMNVEATPIRRLHDIWVKAKESLNYVYVGNAVIEGASDTFCPSCGNLLISRTGYSTRIVGLAGDKCEKCSSQVNVVT